MAIQDLREHFDRILACETGRRSRNIYSYPAPRGRTAVIVGNELAGISKEYLQRVDEVVSVPMRQSQLTSVNVAVAAAVSLYVLERDLARKGVKESDWKQSDVDVLLVGPDDPSEVGSLLRSAWAFGWHKVFLDDCNGVWFAKDRGTILAGRAAARSEKNPIVVIPSEQLKFSQYDLVLVCDNQAGGRPLSRLKMPRANRTLVVFGEGNIAFRERTIVERIVVDYSCKDIEPRYRHTGSTLLSYISQCVRSHSRHG